MEVRNSIYLNDGMSPVLSKILTSLRLTLTTLNNTPGEAGLFRAAQRDISRANQLLNGFNEEARQSQNIIRNLGYKDDNPIGNVFSKAMNPLTELVAGVYLLKSAINSVGKITALGDSLMLNQARLNIVNDGMRTQQQLAQSIYESAQRSRADYLATSQVIGRMGILAGEAFKDNNELINFTEMVNKAFLVGGSTQQEQRAAMYQLTQAMASGRLQGDEMRTIRESAPLLRKAIQSYMGLDTTAFKEAQKNGEITAEVIKNAVLEASGEIQTKFNQIPITFEQAMTMAGNSLLTGMEGIFTGISGYGVKTIKFLTANFEVLAGLITYIAGVSLVMLIRNIAAAIPGLLTMVLGFTAMNWQVLTVVAAVMVLFKLFLEFPAALGVIIGGVKALGTAFMNMIKLVADYFIFLFNEIILKGVNLVLNKLGKEKIQNVGYFELESVGLSYLEGYSSGKKWAEDTGVKIDNFMGGVKNTFNPDSWAMTGGGGSSGKMGDIDSVGEVKNLKGGKVALDDDSIKWLKDAGAIEFVNRFTTMRPVMRVNFGDVHQTADVNEIADAIADMVENAVTTSLEGV